jgi:hypothetical protein
VGWGWLAQPAGGQGHGQGSSSDDDESPSVGLTVREALNRGVALHRAGDLDAAEEW